ncbi:hypothetical protein [Nonomuraea sp. NPDC048916]|uniref:hypothetical protein n=1 Tax=Nonomuraea sp. NPDC048916 TaxID=3154232 RepID=UPI0033D9ED62
MSEELYEISHDMGDDPQESWIAMYLDRLPQLHRIDEIDDEVARNISRWVREEDGRESDTHLDLLEEPRSYFEEEDH